MNSIEIQATPEGLIEGGLEIRPGNTPIFRVRVPNELRWHLAELNQTNPEAVKNLAALVGQAYGAGFGSGTKGAPQKPRRGTHRVLHHTGDA
jgi:hypothetical protein